MDKSFDALPLPPHPSSFYNKHQESLHRPTFKQQFKKELSTPSYLYNLSINPHDWRLLFAQSYHPYIISPIKLLILRFILFFIFAAIFIAEFIQTEITCKHRNTSNKLFNTYYAYLTNWGYTINVLNTITLFIASCAAIYTWSSDKYYCEEGKIEAYNITSIVTPDDSPKSTNASATIDVPKIYLNNCDAPIHSSDVPPTPISTVVPPTPISTVAPPSPPLTTSASPPTKLLKNYYKLWSCPPHHFNSTNFSPPSPTTSFFISLTWLINTLSIAISLVIVILYWAILVPAGTSPQTFYDYFKHLINASILIFLWCTSNIPFPLLHITYVTLFSVAYVTLLVIIHILQLNVYQPGVVYNVINFNSHLYTSLAIILGAVFILIPLCHLFVYYTYGWYRNHYIITPPEAYDSHETSNV